MRNFFLSLFIILISLLVLFKGISYFNYQKLKPTKHEIALLTERFGDLTIRNENDILRIQNNSFNYLEFGWSGNNPRQKIVIDSLFIRRKALCFERSLLLQKIFVYNKIKIVPVYLYYNTYNPEGTAIFDILKPGLSSHNIFEIIYANKRYIIQTNYKQTHLIGLDEYLKYGGIMPKGTKYIRHLNNRNGSFIEPAWIPDIY